MANFNAAFNFEVFLEVVESDQVDTDNVSGGVLADAAAFIDITAANVVPSGSAVEETGFDVITVTPDGGSAQDIVAKTGNTLADIISAGNPYVAKLEGLKDASLSTDTSSEDVVTYSDDSGYNQSVALSKSWSISLAGVTDYNDPGYQIMRLAEKNNVAGSLRVKIGRTTPKGEIVYGYGTLQGFSEAVEAGSIVEYTVEVAGYGPLGLTLAA